MLSYWGLRLSHIRYYIHVTQLLTSLSEPDGAPQNVRGQNSSSTGILVTWDEVPADQQNGIITGYTISYQSQTENDNGNVAVGANARQKNLTNLQEYVNYNITVFASSVKGDGPASDPSSSRSAELAGLRIRLIRWNR